MIDWLKTFLIKEERKRQREYREEQHALHQRELANNPKVIKYAQLLQAQILVNENLRKQIEALETSLSKAIGERDAARASLPSYESFLESKHKESNDERAT